MIIDNSAGLQFLLSEDIYLLKSDMDSLNFAIPKDKETATDEPIIVAEPAEVYVPATVNRLEPIVQTPALSFTFSGKNQKNFLILCCYPGANAMDEKHLEALIGALQRKQLALDDVAILNKANYPDTKVAELTTYFKPERLLILGKASLVAGWDKFTPNQLESLNGMKALYTFSFAQMLGDRDRTKAFWDQMKVL